MHEATFATFVTNNGHTQLVKSILGLILVKDPLAIYSLAEIPPFCTSDQNAVTWHVWFPIDSPDICIASSFEFKHANYSLLSAQRNNIN